MAESKDGWTRKVRRAMEQFLWRIVGAQVPVVDPPSKVSAGATDWVKDVRADATLHVARAARTETIRAVDRLSEHLEASFGHGHGQG